MLEIKKERVRESVKKKTCVPENYNVSKIRGASAPLLQQSLYYLIHWIRRNINILRSRYVISAVDNRIHYFTLYRIEEKIEWKMNRGRPARTSRNNLSNKLFLTLLSYVELKELYRWQNREECLKFENITTYITYRNKTILLIRNKIVKIVFDLYIYI